MLVAVGDYYFHIPPTKQDFAALPHLGALNDSYRNPSTRMPLSEAKAILMAYTGIKEPVERKPKRLAKPVFKRLGDR